VSASRVLIVYNPNAGKGRGIKHANRLEKALLKKDPRLKITKFSANGLEIMRKFWADFHSEQLEFDIITLIGGDGTVGPNVDCMLKNKIDTPIYCYGKGTANDFSSYFKTNCSPKRAAFSILTQESIHIDTIEVRTSDSEQITYAINVACGGAFTNGVTRYSKKSKKLFGKLAYFMHAFRATFKLKSQAVNFTVENKNTQITEHLTEEIFLFYILNTANIGGLRNCAPLASARDGLLDLVCVKKCGFFGKMSLALHQAFHRMHKCKHVIYIQGTHFTVSPIEPSISNFTKTDIDGNSAGSYPLFATLGPKIQVISRKKCK